MAHTLSANKRIRQNAKANARNRWRKRQIHTATKAFDEIVLHHGSADDAAKAMQKAISVLDRTATKGTIHPNKAARKKSRMAKKLHALQSQKKG